KKGGARCKHRPPPKMTHQQDLTKSQINYNLAGVLTILTDWQKGNINASVTELTTSLAAIARHHWQ
ncbi:hypothetical protein LR965_09915, partial [Limosilactobacillus fermentum]|nr:hypothetical protein [Limosilactobacillus fermentum]